MADKKDYRNKIEELKKRLNSRTYSPNEEREDLRVFNKEPLNVEEEWKDPEIEPNINYQSLKSVANRRRSFLKTFLMLSVLFFIVALGIASYVIFGGRNIISSENVEISVSGPISISGGETLSLDVIISNKNNTDLELTDLIIEYPEGTRSPDNLSTELPRERFSMGRIISGGKNSQKVQAILFGEEGDRHKIKMTLEYRVTGSSAIFFKEREYEVEISSSPVSFNIESLIDVNSGQEITLDIFLKSNSNSLIEDLMFIIEYPFGFTFKDSTPSPSFDQNIWKIGDLSPGEERKITISGKIEGQDGEERVFRLFSGIQSDKSEKELQTAFISSTRSVFIKKPFLSIDVSLDGNSSLNHNASMDRSVKVDVSWRNNLSTSVANVEIEASISGDYDEPSIFVEKGFYDSINNIVLWSQERNEVLESVKPGQSGNVSFRFSSSEFAGSSLVNPEVKIIFNVRGRRLSETNVAEEIESSAERLIRFNSELSVVPRIIHFSSPISNSGPIPPKAESKTTYNVIWTVSNTVNNISDAVVSARIPSYVGWTGNVLSNGEDVSFNPVTREVTWNVGNVLAGTGSRVLPREAVFQIALLPSLSQVGEAPVLIERVRIAGKDLFTGTVIEDVKGDLTTRISTDPEYIEGDDKVVE
jgi:hypothetical protein